MKPIELSKVFPIQNIEKGFLINGNGDLTFGFSLMLPEVYSKSVTDYNIYMWDLAGMFSRVPAGTLIHKQDFYYLDSFKPLYDPSMTFARKHNLRHLDQRPVLRHYSNLFVTVSSDVSFSGTDRPNSFLSQLDFVFKRPFANYDKFMEKAEEVVTTIENTLKGIESLKAVRLSDKQLLGALVDYWNLSYNKPCLEPVGVSFQPWEIDPDLKIGTEYVGLLSLTEEGPFVETARNAKTVSGDSFDNGNSFSNSVRLPTSLSFPIGLGFPVNHIINTTFEVFDPEWLSVKLEIEKRKSNLLAGMGHSPSKNKNQEIDFFREAVAKGDVQPGRACVNMILHHEDKKVLNNYKSLAEGAFRNMNGSKVWKENFDTAYLFIASSPGNFKTNYRGFIATSQHAVNYMPWETHYKSDTGGILLLDYFGNPCLLDTWASEYITGARNGLVFGPTGTGKSVFINGLCDDNLYGGAHVIILDVGGSYKKLCEIHNGLYIDSKDREKLTFNIFICHQDKDGNYLYNLDDEGKISDDQINYVYSVLSYIWKAGEAITQSERAIFRDCIKCFYDHVNEHKIFPTLIEFTEYVNIFEREMDERDKVLFNARTIQVTLREYTSGQYRELLNSTSNIQIKDYRLIVIDVENIQKNNDILNIVSLIIIQLVMDKMAELDLATKKVFIIDEAIDFLKGGDMSDFIAGMYRKIRKKGGQVILATQDAAYLEEIPQMVSKSIVSNADIKILLNHKGKEATYPVLRNLLSFTDSDFDLLNSIENGPGYRGLFIKIGVMSRLFRTALSDEALAVYTTDANHLSAIEKEYKRLGNLGSAINQYVENKRLSTTKR